MEPNLALRPVLQSDYSQLSVRHDRAEGILWYYLNPEPRPCFNRQLLSDLRRFQHHVVRAFNASRNNVQDIRFLVAGSRIPGVFNLGGDLALLIHSIKEHDRGALTKYARTCVDTIYANAVNLQLPVTTISLVQGSALGGGFEAALSSNVLIAERSAQMGLPEILFNLFPGMGGYSLLARRLDPARAERMISSGRIYNAEELYDMALVDVLAEDGCGEQAVYEYVRKHKRHGLGATAIHNVRQRYNSISYDELLDISLIWVDTAMQLNSRDLAVMARIAKMQDRMGTAEMLRSAESAA